MTTLAIFENSNDGSKLRVDVEANAIIYTFIEGKCTHCEVEETPFSKNTLVSILSLFDKASKGQDGINLCIGGTKVLSKYFEDGKICFSVGNHSYTSMSYRKF